jgi:exodeoxyribonuclease VII large subunit
MAGRRGPTARSNPEQIPLRGVIDGAEQGPPGSSPELALTITALNTAIKDTLEGMLPPVWVSGEINQFKLHQNGHWYFSLKDTEGAVLDCVVWKNDQGRFPMAPEIGMQVFARGQLNIWVKQPRVQFRVTALEDQGEGIWRKAFEKTKAALEKDGLLDPARKRALPRFPRVVAVITSPSGAAMHDIVSVVTRRNHTIDIVVIAAAVQGDSAPASLVAALERAARWNGADVLIIGRGGGSREDLWCFNDERVARAIAASPIPVISAVGHEVDVSIADFVADVRAATPTAAAELVSPALADLKADLAAMGALMREALVRLARDGRRDLDHVRSAIRNGVARRVTGARETLRVTLREAKTRLARAIERRRDKVGAISGKLHVLSPLATMERGYSIALSVDGKALSRVAQFSAGANFVLKVQDGEVDASARAVRKEKTRKTP